MKKKFVMVFGITLVTAMTVSVAGFPSDPCMGISIRKLRQQVPIPPATILSKKAVAGMCEVILDIRGQYVPVYAGPDSVSYTHLTLPTN